MSLKGNFKNFSLGKVLEAISNNSYTGTLTINYGSLQKEESCYINFVKGEITSASLTSRKGFRLGELLIREKKLTQEQLSKALKLQKKQGKKLGEILVSKKIVNEKEISDALESQLLEELYDLFLLSSGDFEFNLNVPPSVESTDSIYHSLTIKLDPHPLINEGLKRVEEWNTFKEHITTGNEIFTRTDKAPCKFEYNEAESYKVIDGRASVSKLSEKIILGRFQCTKAIFNLVKEGFVRQLTISELMEKAEKATVEQLTGFLSFALQLNSFDIDLRLRTARAFSSAGERETALHVLQEGLPKLHGLDNQKKLEFSKEILLIEPDESYALKIAFDSSLALDRHEDAVNYALLLNDEFISDNKNSEAKKVLLQVNDFVQNDFTLRLRIAKAWRSAGYPEEAVPHLEVLAEQYKKEERAEDLADVFKWILEGDSDRQDIQFRLNKLKLSVQSKSSKRLKRVIFGAASFIIIVSAFFSFFLYENRAETAHASILEKETDLILNRKFGELEGLYEEFLDSFSWSSQGEKVEAALRRIRKLRTHMKDSQK